jgi:Family of unknown function (DUF6314)
VSRRVAAVNEDPPSLQVLDALGFLIGTWHLDRSIEDHRAGTRGSFVGEASLIETKTDSGSGALERARYDEVGELRFGAYRGPASRALDYLRLDAASVLLCFVDGRPYIDLDLRTGTCERIHNCGEDRYEVKVVVRSHDVLEEHWAVEGPEKDYYAVTTLTRA